MDIAAAVVHRQGGPFVLERIDLDGPQDDEILVKIAAVGICHTDIAVRDGDIPLPYPSVLGHEGAGIVVKAGNGVKEFTPGDHIVLSFASCGDCTACKACKPGRCESFMPLNLGGRRPDGSCTHHLHGAPLHAGFFGQSSFGAFAVVKARYAVLAPPDLALEMLAPLGCGIQTGAGAVLNVLKPDRGDSIAIFGAGAVGLSAIMAAKLNDCDQIIAIDMNERRLALAKELGATHALHAGAANVVEEVVALSDGGVSHVVEASGASVAIKNAILCVRPFGHVALLGAPMRGAEVTLPAQALLSGARIQGVIEGDSNPRTFIPELIALHRAGKLPFDRLITLYNFEDINRAVSDAESGDVIKPVLRAPV